MKIVVNKVFLLFLFSLFAHSAVQATQKTDTIYFQNGDKLTCEFKELINSLLTVKTSDAGTIEVKWEKIDSLYIKQYLAITLEDGEIIVGTIMPSGEVGVDIVVGHFGLRKVPHLSIVMINPYRKRTIERFSGSLGSGFSFVKANKQGKMDIQANLNYNTDNTILSANYDANFSFQESAETTRRQNASLNYLSLLKKRFNYNIELAYDQNSELGLDSRFTFGTGFGKFVVNNYHSRAMVGVGLQVNREYSIDSVGNNAEGNVAVTYNFFKHTFPKLDFSVSGNLYPNLVDFERVRATMDSKVRWELFDDFYFKSTLYYTFDSKPLDVNAERADWGLTVGFDFTFSN